MKKKLKKPVKCKLRVGDEIRVLTGKDKGKPGNILRILKKDNRAVVEGINLVSKHVRPNPQKGIEGGIVRREAAIDLSNIAIYNPTTQKADRIGYIFKEDGEKVRVFKSNQEIIDI